MLVVDGADFFGGFAEEVFGEHGSGGLANGAAVAVEFDFIDAALVVEVEVDFDDVAAGRVVFDGVGLGVGDFSFVDRVFVVVEDGFGVEVHDELKVKS